MSNRYVPEKKYYRVGETNTNRYGSNLTILNYRGTNDIDVEILSIIDGEEKKYIKTTTYNNFLEGRVCSPYDRTIGGVGYIGIVKNVDKSIKRIWASIIQHLKMKYKEDADKYISPEFQCYKEFCKWYKKNSYILNDEKSVITLNLSKEKIYSAENCIMIPRSLYRIIERNKSDCSIIHTKTLNKYKILIPIGRYITEVKYFDSKEQALEAYKEGKEQYIRDLADQYWEDGGKYIPEFNKVYEKMINYKI